MDLSINHQQYHHVSNNNPKPVLSGKEELLQIAIIELYLGLKQRLKNQGQSRNEGDDSFQEGPDPQVVEDEKKRLMQLGNLVVIDYIRSSMDILLNMKLEEALLENAQRSRGKQMDMYINSSRGGHGVNLESISDSQRSSSQSMMTSRDEPPKVYEEMIQSLEADVRKHIRIEQQLKLHIESVEYRVDELELENEKLQNETSSFAEMQEHMEATHKQVVDKLERELASFKHELKESSSRHAQEVRVIKEKYETEKEKLKNEIQRFQGELLNAQSASPLVQDLCPSCMRNLRSLNKTSGLLDSNSRSTSKNNRKELSLETLDKKSTSNTKKQMFFKRQNMSICNCTCSNCQIAHQQNDGFSSAQQLSTTSHYKNMQKQYFERPILSSIKQDSNDLQKIQKDFNKFMVAEKRQQSGNKKRGNASTTNTTYNNNLSNISIGSPERQNQNLKGLLSALTISQTTQNRAQSKKANTFTMAQPSCCCSGQQSMTTKMANVNSSYWTCQNDDNPYLQGLAQMHPQLLSKAGESASNMKNPMFFDQSSNASLSQNDNSMIILQSQSATAKRRQTLAPSGCLLSGPLDPEISFLANGRAGLSNDATAMMGFSDIREMELEDPSTDSVLNSHRRSRSQNVGGSSAKHAKSERKGGRMAMMKKRLNKIGSSNNQNDILKSGAYQTTKNGSIQRETTPLKNLSQNKQQFNNNQNILNSDERQKLFNTFMKEMTQSLRDNNQQNSISKKKKNSAHESVQAMRGISTSSSRPRSQLGMANNTSQSNNNYSSIAGQNGANSLKYKFVSGSSSGMPVNQSRNNPIHKIKDFFIHNTYNANIGNNSSGSFANQILSMGGNTQQNRQSLNKKNHLMQENYQISPIRKKPRFEVVAEALAKQNLTHVFGIVGIPVIELGMALQGNGLNYFGFRNEQAAAYAAGIVGYITRRPGIVLAVSGPGMTNCISGMANAMVNKQPMICISGASDASLDGRGAFQEFDQLACARPVSKYAARPSCIKHIPLIVERAVRMSMYGTPGPVYIDLPADIIFGKIDASEISYYPTVELLPQLQLTQCQVSQTMQLLKSAKAPLVIVGKGVAYGQAEKEMRSFIEKSNLPFLATPMGKGVVSDKDSHSVGSARTFVLKTADVIFLCGARLNWILHFGAPPRFRKDVKIIQLESDPLDINTNVKAEIPLVGDAKTILGQLAEAVKEPIQSKDGEWWKALSQQTEKNKVATDKLNKDMAIPMNYYSTLKIVEDSIHALSQDFILVSEGSNTMDIGRAILSNTQPRQRLDAGTFGTMGVGFGYAIAAQSLFPEKKVVMVVGDSAFGFSGMELETAVRYRLPLKVIIINNNGIGQGIESIEKDDNPKDLPVNALSPGAQYELVSIAFGGKGACVKDHKSLAEKLKEMLNDDHLWVLNVLIDPNAGRKQQEFSWLTREDESKKPADAKL